MCDDTVKNQGVLLAFLKTHRVLFVIESFLIQILLSFYVLQVFLILLLFTSSYFSNNSRSSCIFICKFSLSFNDYRSDERSIQHFVCNSYNVLSRKSTSQYSMDIGIGTANTIMIIATIIIPKIVNPFTMNYVLLQSYLIKIISTIKRE